ncbi:diguanylate cyclase [Arcobacter sp. CECT 8985]|uniref:GGDEF domain-containing response regulator n=1 Tax=Arcobacter sp. CECT 8985 TaxID=1935424 RepID=UPI00100B547E|nr:diguanylate cyclase [Arcobacter sp. CECT 8985]RXJ87557.1 diguanylate cyclase response regulator [Arcobacter sp. CECT 8985]
MNNEVLKNVKVLYVEDENDVREFTGRTIKAIVKEIIIKENGKEGLEAFKENLDIDLIVTDINMPKMGGLEMCAEIRKINKEVPIVITSAHNDPDFLKQAIDVGVSAYAMKPIDLYQLIESMIKAIEPIFLKKQLKETNLFLEERVEEGIEKIKSILDSQDNIIFVSSKDTITNVNKKFLEFFNVDSLEEFNSKIPCITSLFKEEKACFNLNSITGDEKNWIKYLINLNEVDRIVKITNQDRQDRIFTVNIDAYKNNDFYVISLTDITELKEKSNLLEYQANHDLLTGLFNRQKFHEIFGKEIRRDKRYENNLSLILFDIDHFKIFNDKYGHNLGDEVLKFIAKIVSKNVREHDTIVRWGGEEFIVLLPETNLEGAFKVAEKIRVALEEFKDDSIPEKITSSFGVTTLKKGDTENSFIEKADEALYEAKKQGRNRVIIKS